jgi:hypothetical protein
MSFQMALFLLIAESNTAIIVDYPPGKKHAIGRRMALQ